MSERGDVIAGRYRLLDRVGSGGMGAVWVARDELLQRHVAVKRLQPEAAAVRSSGVGPERAIREARIAARLHHPNVVPVFDAVEDDGGQPYLVMQYFPSRSLHEILTEQPVLPLAVVARIGAELASALAVAHRLGIVHRNVKPGNVLIAADGTSKITDFGTAHMTGDVTLSSTTVVTGTPAYLAPEVARGEESSGASDVFALGATLYRALEGRPPFAQTPPERSDDLTPVLLRMLAADPDDRPRMDEVARLLREIDRNQTVPMVASPPEGSIVPPQDSAVPAGAEHGEGPRRRWGTTQGVAVLVLALAIAVVTAGVATGRRSGGDEASRGNTAVLNSEEGQPQASEATATSEATAISEAATTTGASTTAASPSTTVGSDDPANVETTAAQAEDAVRSYYRLLPADVDAGWALLTDRYRRTTARNRATYDSFWGEVNTVAVSDATGSASGSVTATITYAFASGRTFVERTSYQMVRQDGVLKIDRSTVLSSAQRQT